MNQAVPYFGRFLSKLFLEIIPGALVSMLAAYLLSMLHLAQGAEPTSLSQAVTTVQNDGLSADERRELTRQMLRERRENPEEPAEVKPLPSLRATGSPTEATDLAHVTSPDPIGAPSPATEPKLRAEPESKPRSESRPAVAAVAPTTPLPRSPAARPRIESIAAPATVPASPAAVAAPITVAPAPTVTAALPPAAAAPPGAPAAAPGGGPTPLPPVTVSAPAADPAAQPSQRGIVGNVFSGISTIAGGAANITGNTVNWVIDLPGKAISAGGKLLTGSTPASAPAGSGASAGSPAPAVAPAAAPAPPPTVDPMRRNYL